MNSYILFGCVLSAILLAPFIFKYFLSLQRDSLKSDIEELLNCLNKAIRTNNTEIHKKDIYHGIQYVICVDMSWRSSNIETSCVEHKVCYFVLSVYKKYLLLEIPKSHLNKKISITSENYYFRSIVKNINEAYDLQQNKKDQHEVIQTSINPV